MKRYIDVDRLTVEIKRRKELLENGTANPEVMKRVEGVLKGYNSILDFITSFQQEQPELSGYDKALLEVKSKVDEIYETTSIGLNEYDSGLYNGIAETCMKLRGFIKARLGFDEQPERTCKTCGFYENNCPFIRGKFMPYPNIVCKDYTCSAMKEQELSEAPSNLIDADAVRDDFVSEIYRVLDADPTNDRANAIINAFDSLPTIQQEQAEVDLEKEIEQVVKNEERFMKFQVKSQLIKYVARHFYKLGLNARKEE